MIGGWRFCIRSPSGQKSTTRGRLPARWKPRRGPISPVSCAVARAAAGDEMEPHHKARQDWNGVSNVGAMTDQHPALCLQFEDSAAGRASRGLAVGQAGGSLSIADLHQVIQLLMGWMTIICIAVASMAGTTASPTSA